VGIKRQSEHDGHEDDDDGDESHNEDNNQIGSNKDKNGDEKEHGGNTGGGCQKSRVFLFDRGHPLYHSHCQYLRSIQPTLIYNGYAPKNPGSCPQCPKSTDPKIIKAYDLDYKS
jgi:hypothetical protein